MNCCWLLILLFLCGGNGFGCPNRSRCDGNDHDHHHDHGCGCEERRPSRFDSCGCDNDLIQPRAFSGFPNVGTCGCEEKDDHHDHHHDHNDCER